ncbi:hypothetical protein [Stenotrophomonas maltophilia]|uniref:hypothetical protein n=1 Tax=Stenotrophomonas maltophilia TaxID=40324 RepID=UPI003BF8304A
MINVILRRDYVGTEVNLRYETTDDGEAPVRTGNLTAGFALEGGRTQVLLSAQYQMTSELRAKDRDFLQRGRARQLANTPDSLLIPSGVTGNPPAGMLVNVRSANGTALPNLRVSLDYFRIKKNNNITRGHQLRPRRNNGQQLHERVALCRPRRPGTVSYQHGHVWVRNNARAEADVGGRRRASVGTADRSFAAQQRPRLEALR